MRTTLLLALSAVVCAAGWDRTLRWDTSLTGMHQVDWRDANGEPASCGGHSDVGLTTLRSGEGIYTTCTGGERTPHGALAYVAPARGQGRIAWPMPAELPLRWTEGLLPGHAGLAYVYRTDGPLAVAIAGPDGWQVVPRALPGGALLGMAWAGETLEVAVRPDGAAPLVVRIEADGRPVERAVVACASEQTSCVAIAAQLRDASWHWFVPDFALDGQSPRLLDVADGRVFATWPYTIEFPRNADLTRIGRLSSEGAPELVLEADGRLVPPSPDARPGTPVTGHFEVADGHLRGRPARWDDASGLTLGDRSVSLARTDALVVDDRVVARVSSRPLFGDFVPRTAGGTWFVTPDGRYLALGDGLERLDPLGLVEHLRHRGSRVTWDEPRHPWKLAWVLFGLPLVLGLGAVVTRASSGRFGVSTVALALYLVTAAVALATVHPLLD